MDTLGLCGSVRTIEAEPATNYPIERPAAEQWYALAVKPRHDKAVSRALEHKGYQTLVPLYKKCHRCGPRLQESELPLFPGYVFCRFDPVTRLPILMTAGVIQVLGAGRKPIPVDDGEITTLQKALKLGLRVSPYPFVQAGRRVRITEGVLTGIEGIVMNIKPQFRVVLSITLLQRSVLVEVDGHSVRMEGLAA